MGLSDDERGQAIQVGFILIFGVLVISFASYQAFVVPGQNSEVEFNHNQQVQGQLQDLRNAIVSSVGRATTTAVAVDLGTTYPSRLVAANPPPPSGSLRTVGTTNSGLTLSVNNAVAKDPETADYWNGTQKNFSTGLLEYRPNYNEYNNAPRTVYDNTLLYNQFRSANRTVTGQSLVDGNELTLVVLNGSLNAAGSTSATVDVRSVSAPDGATVVEPESGQNLTVSFVSGLSAEQWNETLAEEFTASAGDDRYVTDVTAESRGDGLYDITLTFEEDATYRLRMAKMGVGNGVSEEPVSYLTETDGASKSVRQGDSATVTLSTRDRFGNSVSGVSINASASSGGFADSDNKKRSGEDGTVTFTYTAGSSTSTGTQQLNFSLGAVASPFNAGAPENVSRSIDVTANGGGSGGGSAFSVDWKRPSQIACESDSACTLNGSQQRRVELTVDTTPVAQGAGIDYAVDNKTVVLVDTREGSTNSTGENSTTIEAQNEGTVRVYTYGGGAGDVIEITVEDFQLATVAFIDEDDDDTLKTIDSDGTVTALIPKSEEQVRGISPVEDITGDGGTEVAYVNNDRDLRYIDTDSGNKQTVVAQEADYGRGVAVGDGTGTGESELYYINDTTDTLYRTYLNGTTEEIIYGNQGCDPTGQGNRNPVEDIDSVADVNDFNGDDNADIVYVNGNSKLAYIQTNNCTKEVVDRPSYSVGSNNGPGVGEIIEYNGQPAIPIVDGNQNFRIVTDGTVDTVPSSYADASRAPLAPVDWDGDGELELVHLNGNQGRDLYYAGVFDAELTEITNEDNKTERGRSEGGIR